MAEDGGSNSPEYEVFRENYDDLVRVDVAKVARLAFSSNFISRESNDVAHNEYTTSTGRANHVLSAILNKVEEKASNFNVFLSCLREVPPMKDMALSLEAQVVAKAHSLTEHTQHLSVSSGQSPNPSKAQEMNGLDNVPRNEGKTGSSDISYYGHTYEKNDLVQNMILKEKAKLSVKVYSEEQNDHDVMHTVQEAKESPNVVKDDSELQAALHSKTLELQSVKEHKKSLIGQLKRAQLLLAEHNLSSMTEDHDNLKVMPKLITHHIVVYGVQECPKATVRHKRLESDMNQITSIISRIDPDIPKESIIGCLRLGRYSESKCRPILVKFSRKSEMLSILSKRRNLTALPDVSIKPEMTHEEHRIEMLLLQKRKELIEEGVDRGSIKLKHGGLYVEDKVYRVHRPMYVTHMHAEEIATHNELEFRQVTSKHEKEISELKETFEVTLDQVRVRLADTEKRLAETRLEKSEEISKKNNEISEIKDQKHALDVKVKDLQQEVKQLGLLKDRQLAEQKTETEKATRLYCEEKLKNHKQVLKEIQDVHKQELDAHKQQLDAHKQELEEAKNAHNRERRQSELLQQQVAELSQELEQLGAPARINIM